MRLMKYRFYLRFLEIFFSIKIDSQTHNRANDMQIEKLRRVTLWSVNNQIFLILTE